VQCILHPLRPLGRSREADERGAACQLRDLRARVKAERAMVATHPGMAETFRGDWRKAAWFYARFGITEGQFCRGVPSLATGEGIGLDTSGVD
jgi:hypothetical protein